MAAPAAGCRSTVSFTASFAAEVLPGLVSVRRRPHRYNLLSHENRRARTFSLVHPNSPASTASRAGFRSVGNREKWCFWICHQCSPEGDAFSGPATDPDPKLWQRLEGGGAQRSLQHGPKRSYGGSQPGSGSGIFGKAIEGTPWAAGPSDVVTGAIAGGDLLRRDRSGPSAPDYKWGSQLGLDGVDGW